MCREHDSPVDRPTRDRPKGRLFYGVPGMGCDQEVKVLWEPDRGNPSEPQGEPERGPSVRTALKEAASETRASTYRNRI
jgi:hypothetical protein